MCRCDWCGWFWPLASAGPHILVCPGRSCMLFDGMKALPGAGVVDPARSARRQSGGSGLGLIPLRTCSRSWGEGGVRPTPPPLKCLLAHRPGARGSSGVFSGLSFVVLGCPLLLLHGRAHSAIVGVCVGGAVGVVARVWCGGGGGSNMSGAGVVAGDVVSCGSGNQISLNLRVLTGLRQPSVTLSLICQITCDSVTANINNLPLFDLPHLSLSLCGCCGV